MYHCYVIDYKIKIIVISSITEKKSVIKLLLLGIMIKILITSDEFLYTKKGGLGFMFNNYICAALYVFLVHQLDMSTSFSVSLNKQFIHSLVLLSSSEMQPPTTLA